MAGTVTPTETLHKSLKRVKFAWTSSAGGAADGATTAYVSGKLEGFATVPSSGSAPTDLYDVVVNDDDGVDVLFGAGANRSASAAQFVQGSSLGAMVESKLTLGVTNAGNAKQGTVYLYFR